MMWAQYDQISGGKSPGEAGLPPGCLYLSVEGHSADALPDFQAHHIDRNIVHEQLAEGRLSWIAPCWDRGGSLLLRISFSIAEFHPTACTARLPSSTWGRRGTALYHDMQFSLPAVSFAPLSPLVASQHIPTQARLYLYNYWLGGRRSSLPSSNAFCDVRVPASGHHDSVVLS